FKQKVIEYKWLHHLSLNQTAAKFSIPNTGTISTWEKLYRSYGFSGLLAKKRGRPSMKKSKSKNKVNKHKKELSYVEQMNLMAKEVLFIKICLLKHQQDDQAQQMK
ncbi:helix-turn-helix domain-containing protein, partial [Megamonas hypermegale]|uniref:helix-turn-helix domain-containing protein n=2 Tax=Megamonas hypermegale TaxID=158847 RepID=UPI00195E5713